METDLCSYITSSKTGCLDGDVCRLLTYQVIVALRYLHGKECGHLDVKCDNILITRLRPIPATNNESIDRVKNPNQDFPLVKLADFGYSRIIGENSFRKTHVGTVCYKNKYDENFLIFISNFFLRESTMHLKSIIAKKVIIDWLICGV